MEGVGVLLSSVSSVSSLSSSLSSVSPLSSVSSLSFSLSSSSLSCSSSSVSCSFSPPSCSPSSLQSFLSPSLSFYPDLSSVSSSVWTAIRVAILRTAPVCTAKVLLHSPMSVDMSSAKLSPIPAMAAGGTARALRTRTSARGRSTAASCYPMAAAG